MSTSALDTEPTKAKIEPLTKEHRVYPFSYYSHEDLKDEVSRLTEASKTIHRIHESRFEERKDGDWEDDIDIALRREHWVAVNLYEDIEIDVMRALRRMRELEKVLLEMPENPYAVQRCEADAVDDEDEEWTLIAANEKDHVVGSSVTASVSIHMQQEKLAQRRLLHFMIFILAFLLLNACGCPQRITN